MKRTPLRRSRTKPWRRADDDKVTPELHAYILKRDGGCIARHFDDPANCWGEITLDHVKDEPRLGDRAASDKWHLVSVCDGHSEKGMRAGHQWNTSRAGRAAERDYLREKEPR